MNMAAGQTGGSEFSLFDVTDFPVIRASGREFPSGYAPRWVAEMEALLARGEPFAFVFLSTVESPTQEDQKTQTKWLKKNKKRFAALCRGAVTVEPDRARRLLKRAQALAITAAFGLRFSVAPDCDEAERRVRRLLAGEALPDDEE